MRLAAVLIGGACLAGLVIWLVLGEGPELERPVVRFGGPGDLDGRTTDDEPDEPPPPPIPDFDGRSGLEWARALCDVKTRGETVAELVRAGPGAVPLLIALLRQPYAHTRWGALLVLFEMADGEGEDAARTLALIAANAPDEDVRRRAIDALGELGPRARDVALRVLRDATTEPWASVRISAALALGEVGGLESLEALVLLRERERDMIALAAATESILSLIRDSVMAGGEVSAERVKILCGILADPISRKWRASAARLLGALAAEAVEAIPTLEQTFREDRYPEVRRAAAFALAGLGYAGVDVLVRELARDGGRDRDDLIDALAAAGPDAVAAVPLLVAAMADEDLVHRAAYALQRIGGVTASRALAGIIRDPQARTCSVEAAIPALVEVDPDGAAPILAQLLRRTDDDSLRRAALVSLSRLGERARVAGIEVAAMVEVREVALFALRALMAMGGREAASLVAARIRRPSHPELRSWLLSRSYLIGRKEPDVIVPALIQALETDDVSCRASAVRSLRNIGPDARAAVPALERLLDDDSRYVRTQARMAIDRIGRE